jgi:predicted cupin superfamily sugar epimerase
MANAEVWIKSLKLLPHPEGGYYRETYRSDISIPDSELPDSYSGRRSAGTSIYYLLKGGQRSLLHRLKSDEIWHHYDGSPIVLSLIHEDGSYEEILLGKNIGEGEIPQVIIKGGTWFGAFPKNDDSYSLAGCTVTPGFDFDDFELAGRQVLLAKYPELESIIKRLTKD